MGEAERSELAVPENSLVSAQTPNHHMLQQVYFWLTKYRKQEYEQILQTPHHAHRQAKTKTVTQTGVSMNS